MLQDNYGQGSPQFNKSYPILQLNKVEEQFQIQTDARCLIGLTQAHLEIECPTELNKVQGCGTREWLKWMSIHKMCHEENVISWCVYVSSLLSCICLAELIKPQKGLRRFQTSLSPPPSHSDQWIFYHLASHLNFATTGFLVLTYFEVFRSCLP